MEARTWHFSMSQGPYRGGEIEGEIGIFPSPRDCMKAVLGIFSSPKAHVDVGVSDPIYWHISSYSFIFSIYSFIFSTYSFIFLAYSFIFTTSRNSRMWGQQGGEGGLHGRGCTRNSWDYSLGPDLEIFPKSPGHFFEWSFPRMWRHQGGGGGGGVLVNPDIT